MCAARRRHRLIPDPTSGTKKWRHAITARGKAKVAQCVRAVVGQNLALRSCRSLTGSTSTRREGLLTKQNQRRSMVRAAPVDNREHHLREQ